MNSIWNQVQSIADKLEAEDEERRRADSLDWQPRAQFQPSAAADRQAQTHFQPRNPWDSPYPEVTYWDQNSAVGSQPMGLLQPGSYEAAMAMAARAGQGPAPTTAPQLGNAGPQIDEIPIKAMPMEEFEQRRRAAAVYGETAGMRPQMIDPKGGINNPNNWDPQSAQALHQARTNLATMYGDVNPGMQTKMPSDMNNPIQKQQWDLAVEAAKASMSNQLDPRLKNMWMRQESVGPQVYGPWVKGGSSPLQQMGPFVNTIPASQYLIDQGRAVAKGSRTYIDFYGKK
jgi:hypothetical protein